jgi:hypothetical protein
MTFVIGLASGTGCFLSDVGNVPTLCSEAPTVTNAAAPEVTGSADAGSGFSPGSIAKYVCNTGFAKTGSDTTCRNNGTWTATPTCTADPALCPEPPQVPNASVTAIAGGVGGGETASFGALATYLCDSSFMKSGTDAFCEPDGSWSTPPHCIARCPELALRDGTVDYAVNGNWVTATYTCGLGYVRSGPAERVCQANHTWFGTAPQCVVSAFVGDFDADGRADDHATWNPLTHTWRARTTQDGDIFAGVVLGADGDIPLVGDFDSDGYVDDLAAYTPATSTFVIRRRDGTNPVPLNVYPSGTIAFGQNGDVPVVGDWDSDGGFVDLAVWRPTTGDWFAIRVSDHATLLLDGFISWGTPDITPLVGDGDSDGVIDDLIVVNSGSTGIRFWYGMRNTHVLIWGLNGYSFGTPLDRVMMSDFDSDGLRDDMVAYHPTGGVGTTAIWAARRRDETDPLPITQATFGKSEDTALMGDFDGDGVCDDLGVYDSNLDTWSSIRTDGTAIMTNIP